MKTVFKISAFLTLVMILTDVFAQEDKYKDRQEQIKSIKIAVYTNVLNLTGDEAAKFWPIYNEFESKIREIKAERLKYGNRVKTNYSSMSDDDFRKAIEQFLNFDQQELDLKKEYYLKLEKAIPVKKILLIPRAETTFKKELLKRIKDYKDDSF